MEALIKEGSRGVTVVEPLLVSNSVQRIYFVVRSMMTTILGAIITLAAFWQLGTINAVEDFILGVSSYVISLTLSRLFDTKILRVSKSILAYLGEHAKLRDLIVKNL